MTIRLLTRLATLLCLVAGPAAADTAHCRALHAAMPEGFGEFRKVAVHDFEPQQAGAGFMTIYEVPGQRLSVFHFDATHAEITPAHVEAYLRNAIGDLQKVTEDRGQTVEDLAAFRAPRDGGVLSLFAEARVPGRGSEFIALGQDGACLVKLRYTTPEPMAKARAAFLQHLSDLGL
jgi:hypothetical protein